MTADFSLWLTGICGVHWERVGPDLASYRGGLHRFAIACTLADAWCGAVPLVYSLTSGLLENVRYLARFALMLFALNIARLTVSHLIYSTGVPWVLAHEFISGLIYLVIWLLILHRKGWRVPLLSSPRVTAERSPCGSVTAF